MLKKSLCFIIILFLAFSFINFSYATDVLMDLDDNTLYSDNQLTNQNVEDTQDLYDNTPVSTLSTTDYEDDTNELSFTTITNIILIAIGFVLVLLGIAIVLKLK